MSQFKNWDDFRKFAKAVKYVRRYVRTSESDAFLDAVRVTARKRILPMRKGASIWRAQRGAHEVIVDESDTIGAHAYCPSRMMPRVLIGPEGRVNAKGMPCFYGATTGATAMSEVRPWAGEHVSLGLFKVVRDLAIVDCSKFHDKSLTMIMLNSLSGMLPQQPDEVEAAVWTHIDHAFSEPITDSDDLPDYIPTQILAEVFKAEGYDGVAYKSTLTDDGFNLALFDRALVKQSHGQLHRTERVRYDFSTEPSDEYYLDEDGVAVRVVISDFRPVPKNGKA